VNYNQAVPTMAERSGNFSDVCPPLVPGGSYPPAFNPSTTSYTDCPIGSATNSGGNYVGSTLNVDPISAALLNTGIIPEPNSSTGCNTTNPSPLAHCYTATVSPPTYWREELFRIDHNLTSKERLSFRYIHDSWNTVTLAPQWGVVHNSFPTVENQLNGPGLNMLFSVAQTLPHDFINLISVSYEVQHISLQPQPGPGLSSLNRPTVLDNQGPGVTGGTSIAGTGLCSGLSTSLTECPMGYIFNNGFGGNKMPGLVFEGNNGAYGGHGFSADTGYAPWNQANPTFILRDDIAKTKGKHSLQFGFEGSYIQQNEMSAVSGANSGDLQGLLRFSNQQSIYTTGNAFADFLAGRGSSNVYGGIKSYTQDSAQAKYYSRYKAADLYFQDDWHALPRLTLNIGLRASFFGAWFNPKSTAYNWRPEAYNPSLGSSVFIEPTYGFLVRTASGAPVPLNRSGGSYNLNPPSPTNPNGLDQTITNGLVQCGVNGLPSSCMKNSVFHPAPRIGFAWVPWVDGKTTIRGGYGLFWEHGTGYEANAGSLIGSAPLVLSETQSNIQFNGTAASSYNSIGFSCQGGTAQCGSLAQTQSGGTTFPLNVTSIPTKTVYSYVQQWSLSLEHQVGKNMVGQLAYVGSKGTHLTAVRDLNQLSPLANSLNPFGAGQPITAGVCTGGANYNYFTVDGVNNLPSITIPSSPGIGPKSPGYTNMFVACSGNPGFVNTNTKKKIGLSADSVRPYPGFSNIISVDNVADSTYNALQATLRQTVGALTVGVAYTYSHSLDDSSDRSSANFANSLDIHSNRASSDFDQRHLLNVSYIYDLPLMKMLQGFGRLAGQADDSPDHGAWIPGQVLKTWLDGWQLSGITTFQTGTPFSVINGGGANGTGAADNAGVGDGLGVGSYADVIGSAKTGKPFVAQSGNNVGPLLLNPGAFAAPRGLTFGNSGRNYLNNPSRVNFNISLFKHFKPFHERLDVEFRAETYNIFNHTQFRITDPANPGNTGNNIISCYGSQTQLYSAGASGCLAGNSFLHPVDAHDPRILQFGLKGQF